MSKRTKPTLRRSHARSTRDYPGAAYPRVLVRNVCMYTCTRAMLLYFVGCARCRAQPLPLVTSGFIFRRDGIFGTRYARWCISFSREKKRKGWKKKGGSRISCWGRVEKVACHECAKSRSLHFVASAIIVSVSQACRMIISTWSRCMYSIYKYSVIIYRQNIFNRIFSYFLILFH